MVCSTPKDLISWIVTHASARDFTVCSMIDYGITLHHWASLKIVIVINLTLKTTWLNVNCTTPTKLSKKKYVPMISDSKLPYWNSVLWSSCKKPSIASCQPFSINNAIFCLHNHVAFRGSNFWISCILEEFFCVGLGSICCVSCYQTYREFSPYANFITANFVTAVFQIKFS